VVQADDDINWNQLHDLSGHDPAFERELLQIFLQDTQTQLARLEAAWAIGDFVEVRLTAHHIKGASANVGAVTLAKWAAQIETAAREQQPDPIQAGVKQLGDSFERLRQKLGE
jgi:HPt (histidine-containing phosphotransfer) domain-containing protein